MVSEETDRRWLTIGLMMCVMAISFESYAVLTAMPAAARDLGNLGLYAWTFTAFVIAMTFSIVASGQFSDRYGPIQPMICSLFSEEKPRGSISSIAIRPSRIGSAKPRVTKLWREER